jgi:hypothetical protein
MVSTSWTLRSPFALYHLFHGGRACFLFFLAACLTLVAAVALTFAAAFLVAVIERDQFGSVEFLDQDQRAQGFDQERYLGSHYRPPEATQSHGQSDPTEVVQPMPRCHQSAKVRETQPPAERCLKQQQGLGWSLGRPGSQPRGQDGPTSHSGPYYATTKHQTSSLDRLTHLTSEISESHTTSRQQ